MIDAGQGGPGAVRPARARAYIPSVPAIRVRLFGAVAVEVDGHRVDLGPPRQRALLALLVAHAGRVVPVDHLVPALWGEQPPRTALHAIQVYVSDLRRLFVEACGRPLVLGRRPGYLVDLAPDEVDALVLEEALREALAHEAAGRAEDALARLRPLLVHVEGEPLEDVREAGVRDDVVPRLVRLRTHTTAVVAHCALRVGDLDTACQAATLCLADEPYDEDVHAVLVEATYRQGRPAEALRLVARVRRLLADELGVDPSPRLSRLHERILVHDPSLATPAEPVAERNPYKGLRPFTEADADDFFGRRVLAGELGERLSGGARLLVVVGPSGGGKSSLLAAGVVPLLRSGVVQGLEDCAVVVPPRTTTTEAGLREAVDGERTGSHPVVLVLDQLEDVLDGDDGDGVMSWLAEELRSPGDLRVVAALRADRYDRPLQHPSFAEMFGPGVVNLVPMTPAELEEAVRAPAARVGRDVEPALLAELIGDTVAQPAVLPLLQFALTELFDRGSGPTLTLAAHHRLGGIRAALARRADALRDELGPEREPVLAQVLLRLTDVDEGGRSLRRVVRVEEAAAVSIDTAAVAAVLGRLNDLRLVTYDRDAHGGGTLELSHDALLAEWPWFRDLVDRHRTHIRRHRAFVGALEAWESTGRDPAYLVTGPRLEEVEVWERDGAIALTPRERAFLDAGLAVTQEAAHRVREQEAHRLALERRARRRLLLLTGAGAALVVAVVAAVTFAGREPLRVALVLHDSGSRELAVERGVDEVARTTSLAREKVLLEQGDQEALLRLTDAGRVDIVVSAALDVDHEDVARRRPDTHFVLLERDAAAPNITVLAFADQEPAFLAGAAAALTSRTGRVAFVGGVDFEVLRRFEAGFLAGAAAGDPGVVVDVRYVTSAPDYEGFVDPARVAAMTREVVEAGADVVYLPAGAAQVGGLQTVVRLAEERDEALWAIGADDDAYDDPRWQTTPQARGHVLASTVKRFDLATRGALVAHLSSGPQPGRRVSDLANGELGFAMTGGHLDAVAPRLLELRREVAAGRIVVPCVPPGLSGAAAAAAAAGVKCPEG